MINSVHWPGGDRQPLRVGDSSCRPNPYEPNRSTDHLCVEKGSAKKRKIKIPASLEEFIKIQHSIQKVYIFRQAKSLDNDRYLFASINRCPFLSYVTDSILCRNLCTSKPFFRYGLFSFMLNVWSIKQTVMHLRNRNRISEVCSGCLAYSKEEEKNVDKNRFNCPKLNP